MNELNNSKKNLNNLKRELKNENDKRANHKHNGA